MRTPIKRENTAKINLPRILKTPTPSKKSTYNKGRQTRALRSKKIGFTREKKRESTAKIKFVPLGQKDRLHQKESTVQNKFASKVYNTDFTTGEHCKK